MTILEKLGGVFKSFGENINDLANRLEEKRILDQKEYLQQEFNDLIKRVFKSELLTNHDIKLLKKYILTELENEKFSNHLVNIQKESIRKRINSFKETLLLEMGLIIGIISLLEKNEENNLVKNSSIIEVNNKLKELNEKSEKVEKKMLEISEYNEKSLENICEILDLYIASVEEGLYDLKKYLVRVILNFDILEIKNEEDIHRLLKI